MPDRIDRAIEAGTDNANAALARRLDREATERTDEIREAEKRGARSRHRAVALVLAVVIVFAGLGAGSLRTYQRDQCQRLNMSHQGTRDAIDGVLRISEATASPADKAQLEALIRNSDARLDKSQPVRSCPGLLP